MQQLLEIVWQNNSDPGKFLTLLIIILGFFAICCALKHTRRYNKKEQRALEDVRQRLQLDLEANPQQLVSLESLREMVQSGHSLIADRLDAIAKMRQAHVKVNLNALQQMSLLKESANLGLAIPGYVVGLA